MTKYLTPSVRRAGAFVLTLLVVALNGPLKLGLDNSMQVALMGFSGAYIAQSAVRQKTEGK